MRRIRHSRSGLFLMELMISILFFAFTAGICIRFFVKSHDMSQAAKNLYQAQQEAASMAELLEKDSNDYADDIYIYYDKNWNQCEEKDKVYWMEVTGIQSQKGEDRLKKNCLREIKLAVYCEKKQHKKEIYHLKLHIYVPPNRETYSNTKRLQTIKNTEPFLNTKEQVLKTGIEKKGVR